MKQFFFILAVIGYLFFLAIALIPALTPLRPVGIYVGMACCALVAVLCGTGGQRWLATLGLVVALAASIAAWRNNKRVLAGMHKHYQEVKQKQEALDAQQTNSSR